MIKQSTMIGVALALAALLAFFPVGCQKDRYIHVGPNWDALNTLNPPEDGFGVSAGGPGKTTLGQDLSFRVSSEKEGRLWVVQVSPDDRMNVMFPNNAVRDNRIAAGETLRIPPRGADWAIAASEPAGKSIVAFVVTTGNIDLTDVLSGNDGMEKAIRVAERAAWGVDKMVIDVRQ